MISAMFVISAVIGVLLILISGALFSENRVKSGTFCLFVISFLITNTILQAAYYETGAIDKVITYNVSLIENKALVPGIDKNFNEYFSRNIEDGAIIYEIKRKSFWKFGYYWFQVDPEYSLEKPE